MTQAQQDNQRLAIEVDRMLGWLERFRAKHAELQNLEREQGRGSARKYYRESDGRFRYIDQLQDVERHMYGYARELRLLGVPYSVVYSD